ncbi:hypothetical protein AVEN_179115-1 [Araneus ventricosus]|uniref:Uncharacterized protein n=1 Tax=Araneus ventricosus TaxID=182803 RepID=A0A4Y2F3K5_ARAVE|nr:hypothetical protein AVEN_179115-1 [Araneus ventricosus]
MPSSWGIQTTRENVHEQHNRRNARESVQHIQDDLQLYDWTIVTKYISVATCSVYMPLTKEAVSHRQQCNRLKDFRYRMHISENDTAFWLSEYSRLQNHS